MDLESFRNDFLSQVAVCASAEGDFTQHAFVEVALSQLADASEVADFQPCYYRGMSGRRAVGIDGYAFDTVDSSLRVFIADPVLSAEGAKLNRDDARSLFNRLRAFVEDSLTGQINEILDDNSPAKEFADLVKLRAERIARVRAYVLTDALLAVKQKDWPEGLIGETEIPVEFHIWDISRFYRAWTSATQKDDITVIFRNERYGAGIPCIQANTPQHEYTGYLCVVPGALLADIYDEYGSKLLEGNVRSFLSTKGKVNRGIRETLLTNEEMFFAYNNGIAATASSIETEADGSGTHLISATDFQIVNGGQTTASISTVRRVDKANLEGAFVPMKLSVIPPAKALEVVPDIAKFANSQNKVSEADFFSNHEFHRRFEAMSRRLWAPARVGSQHETHWFYERARGQYFNEMSALTPGQRRRFMEANPKTQVITKTDLAKSENSWAELPHYVSRGAQTNFLQFAQTVTSRWKEDKNSFHEDYFRAAIARTIVFRTTEALISAQPWYSGGYRANIVTYAIARVAHQVKVQARREVDFKTIWKAQGLSEAFKEQIALAAKQVYFNITKPRAGYENITQWCKREQCWAEVREEPLSLLDAFVAELLTAGEVRSEEREAKALQKIDSGIQAQSEVLALGPQYWDAMAEWGLAQGAISGDDARLLRLLSKAMVPTDKQSIRMIQLRDRMEGLGFIYLANQASVAG